MWPVSDDWYYQAFSGFMGGPPGRWLCRHFNAFVTFVMPTAYGDKAKLTTEILRHYTAALPTGDSRKGTWVFPGQIIGSTNWLADLWARRDQLTAKPAMVAWGMKDIAFREKELRRWASIFPKATVTRYVKAGHFVQDEEGESIAPLIREFIASHP